MRLIRMSSSGPKFVFSDTGQLKVIRTGSDGYAEHKNAADYLCRRRNTGLFPKQGDSPVESGRIIHGEHLQFKKLPVNPESPPEALFGYYGPRGFGYWRNESEQSPIDAPSVLSELKGRERDDIAAAVAYGNFVFRVRGLGNVEALAQFYEAILAGDVVLASCRYFENFGIALINTSLLTQAESKSLQDDPDEFLRTAFNLNRD